MSIERWFYVLSLRARSLFRRGRVEQELDAEIRYHLDRRVEELTAKGLSIGEAIATAQREFEGVERQKEECRDMRGVNILEDLKRDLWYGLRMLKASPGFTVTAGLSLALGVGANIAIFQLLNAITLRSLPVHNPQELCEVRVEGGHRGIMNSSGSFAEITNPLWEQIREHQQGFSGVFAWRPDDFQIGQGAARKDVLGFYASGEFFSTLGTAPALGRLLNSQDDYRGCGGRGVVLSHGFWQREYGGRESVLGEKLYINDQLFEIIGVTAPSFTGIEIGNRFDLAIPLCSAALWGGILDARHEWWLTVIGRLKPGWTLEQTSAHLKSISPGMFEATLPTGYGTSNNKTYLKLRLAAYPAGNGVSVLRKEYNKSLQFLLGLTGMVLLIACANLANLLLARSSAREREIAVRLAIGAGRGRLLRQLLSESLLLSAIGAALGVGVAWFFSWGIVRYVSDEDATVPLDFGMDGRVFVFTLATAALTCLLFGLAPAIRASRISPGAAMKNGGRLSGGRDRYFFQRLLVVAQITISLTLLVAALLFVRGFRTLITTDPGFKTKGVLAGSVSFGRIKLSPERQLLMKQQLIDRIRALPGVEAAATTTNIPLSGSSWTMGIKMIGGGKVDDTTSKITWVSPGFFQTLEIPLLDGRDISPNDKAGAVNSAVVNQSFVRKFLSGANPIGRVFRTSAEPNYPETEYEIVGVVRDVKYSGLREDAPPITYVAAAQRPNSGPWFGLTLRSSGQLDELKLALKKALAEVHPDIEVRPYVMETQIRDRLKMQALMALLSGFFGLLALVLSTIGLYGVISYTMARRKNEIGIRMALGATRANVLWLALKECLTMVFVGILLGAGITIGLMRLVSTAVFGVGAVEPWTILFAAMLMTAIALLAGYLPARHASRVDPMIALRAE